MIAQLLVLIQRLLGRSDIYFAGSLYMRRWRIVDLPWFGIRLHHIARSDKDRELHDHPFTFASLILRGGYYEHTIDGRRVWYGPGSLVIRSGEALHRLELEREDFCERSAWTLVFRGARRRAWGFLTPTGWETWEQFVSTRRPVDAGSQKYAATSSI